MICLLRRFRFLACGLGFALAGSASQAAIISVKAVKINGTPIAPTSSINADPGDRIETEVFIRGWNADEPGGALNTFQFQIDGKNNFFKMLNGENVNVAQPGCYDRGTLSKCMVLGECPPGYNRCSAGMICELSCTNDGQCSPTFPHCVTNGGFCTGNNHMPDMCTFVDTTRNDFALFAAVNPQPLGACSFPGADILCGASSFQAGNVDPGQSRYLATVTIDLTDDACGQIVPAVAPDVNDTFILMASGETYATSIENLTINVSVPCGKCSAIIASVPANCEVDARTPSSLVLAVPPFWFNDDFDFDLTFVAAPEGGFEQSQFSITTEPVQTGTPAIDGFSVNGNTVTISAQRPPSFAGPQARWLCINFDDPGTNCPNGRRCWARLPGDVDGNRTTASADLTALIIGLNVGDLAMTRCDMDRSGACRAPDLLMWIDIANGAGILIPNLGLSLPVCPSQ